MYEYTNSYTHCQRFLVNTFVEFETKRLFSKTIQFNIYKVYPINYMICPSRP